MESSVDKSLGEVTVPCVFTFVPVVQKLPIKSSLEKTSGALEGKQQENIAASHKETTREAMSEEQLFRAVYIKSSEGEERDTIQPDKNTACVPPLGHVSLSESLPAVSYQSQNTPHLGAATMEAAANKHRDISQRRYQSVPGRAEPHKIKSSYKSLAAIPTNTLLLDQQVIDEQVERGEGPDDTGDRGVPLGRGVMDTHKEMCSPAQLRKESEELYAVIDEILGSAIPPTSRTALTNSEAQRNSSTSPQTYGRETKYASLGSLYSSGNGERKMDPNKTKPGVIRPMTAIPRLTVPDKDKNFDANPFRQFLVKQALGDNRKGARISREDILQDTGTHSKGQTQREDALSACDLHITEPEEQISRPEKHGSHLSTPTSFCPAERKLDAFQIHI